MKKKLAIINPEDSSCFLSRILNDEYNIASIGLDSGKTPVLNEYDIILVSIPSGNIDVNTYLKKLTGVNVPVIFVVSLINYKQLQNLYLYTDNVIFLPVSVSFLKNRINMTLNPHGISVNNEQIRIRNQFLNILQLQKTIKKIRKIVPDVIKNISSESIEYASSPDENYSLIQSAEKALENNHFSMNYQPVIDINTNKVFGFEALIRWNDPEKGPTSPEDFIPILEKSDFIYELTYWILEQSIMMIDKLNSMSEEYFRINVNICAHHFHLKELPDKIEKIRKKYSVEPRQIGIEITESAFMGDMDTANINLLRLKSLGYPLYMDDFGTGYSSLSYLQHFPVDVLKIDKSFVTWMHVDEQSEMIVKTIIALAHGLNMEVVAEGVESGEHIEMLKSFNCKYVQGYFYSKPINDEEVLAFIKEHLKSS